MQETENESTRLTKISTFARSDGTKDRGFKGIVRLNRSQRWPQALTYQQAREQSPSAEPVR